MTTADGSRASDSRAGSGCNRAWFRKFCRGEKWEYGYQEETYPVCMDCDRPCNPINRCECRSSSEACFLFLGRRTRKSICSRGGRESKTPGVCVLSPSLAHQIVNRFPTA